MKRVEITVPSGAEEEAAKKIVAEYDDDFTSSEVEKENQIFRSIQASLASDEIDELTERLKDITALDTGDLTIEVLEATAHIEKGKRQEGGTSGLSVQEMYARAFEFASFERETWALIALGAGIAVFGAIMENMMVVIGSMVITPILGPFIAASFGLVIGDRTLIRDSLFYGTLSILLAVSSAFVVALTMPVRVTPLILLIGDAGFATIPLSLFVGSAAALTFTTESRETLAGVAVAIALVPPAAVVGIAISLLNIRLLFDTALILLSNITSLILAGSITFKLLGITPGTYYRKKVSEEKLQQALTLSMGSILVIGTIVGFLSYQDLQQSYVQTDIEEFIDTEFGERVLTQDVEVSGDRVQVTLAVVDPQYSEAELETALANRTHRQATVTLISVAGTSPGDG